MEHGDVAGPNRAGAGLDSLGPLALDLLLLPKVWGGDSLQALGDPPTSGGPSIGEAWLLYDRPEGASLVRGAKQSLADLRAANAADLIGTAAVGYGGRFPLLVKYLHARVSLSLQVHPGDAAAVGDGGKEECWLVLEAGSSAKAYLGLREGVSTDRLVAAVASGEAAEVQALLNVLELRVGDVVHVPPGTVHALGGDALVLEVQQNSDITYRLSDWGRGREVHVAEAVPCIDIDSRPRLNQEVVAVAGGGHRLVSTPSFAMFRHRIDEPVDVAMHGGYCVLVCLDGGGVVMAGGKERQLSRQAVLVPACFGSFVVRPDAGMDLVLCAPFDVTVSPRA